MRCACCLLPKDAFTRAPGSIQVPYADRRDSADVPATNDAAQADHLNEWQLHDLNFFRQRLGQCGDGELLLVAQDRANSPHFAETFDDKRAVFDDGQGLSEIAQFYLIFCGLMFVAEDTIIGRMETAIDAILNPN
jgi:hypothetical protein